MENKEISLSAAMRLMVDEDKVINAKAEGVYAPNNFSAGFVAKHGLGVRVWEVRFKDGTFQFRCPGDDDWLTHFHFEKEYKYYLQEEKKKYWLWANPSSGYVSSIYRDERGSVPGSSDILNNFSEWIKLPWSEIEL